VDVRGPLDATGSMNFYHELGLRDLMIEMTTTTFIHIRTGSGELYEVASKSRFYPFL